LRVSVINFTCEYSAPFHAASPPGLCPGKGRNGQELELPVISTWSYKDLKSAPCRYNGSAYSHDLVLCAHNYVSHFGRLKDLHEGDTATFTDMDGNLFPYVMVERETLEPASLEEMCAGDWDLTLFTCTVGGRSRVTIRFVLEEEASQNPAPRLSQQGGGCS